MGMGFPIRGDVAGGRRVGVRFFQGAAAAVFSLPASGEIPTWRWRDRRQGRRLRLRRDLPPAAATPCWQLACGWAWAEARGWRCRGRERERRRHVGAAVRPFSNASRWVGRPVRSRRCAARPSRFPRRPRGSPPFSAYPIASQCVSPVPLPSAPRTGAHSRAGERNANVRPLVGSRLPVGSSQAGRQCQAQVGEVALPHWPPPAEHVCQLTALPPQPMHGLPFDSHLHYAVPHDQIAWFMQFNWPGSCTARRELIEEESTLCSRECVNHRRSPRPLSVWRR
eukprot:354423-Chlamydomonas_euryale.AAC.2